MTPRLQMMVSCCPSLGAPSFTWKVVENSHLRRSMPRRLRTTGKPPVVEALSPHRPDVWRTSVPRRTYSLARITPKDLGFLLTIMGLRKGRPGLISRHTGSGRFPSTRVRYCEPIDSPGPHLLRSWLPVQIIQKKSSYCRWSLPKPRARELPGISPSPVGPEEARSSRCSVPVTLNTVNRIYTLQISSVQLYFSD